MARQEAFQGSLPLLVLKILGRRGPMHGYGITVRIREISEEVLRVEEGSLYPALHRMEKAGWIVAKMLSRLLNVLRRDRVFQVKPSDLWSIAAPLTWLLVARALSALVPVRRATRVEPTAALRYE